MVEMGRLSMARGVKMSKVRKFLCLLTVSSLLMAFAAAAPGTVIGTYTLGPPTLSDTKASFELSLEFTADAGEQLVFFGVDVSSSSDSLTGAGTDFSAFSFTRASPLLDGWDSIPGSGFGVGLLKSVADFDTITDPLPPDDYVLGTLMVDFTSTGVAAGTRATVSINAFNSVIGVELPGQPQTFEFVDVDFQPASQSFIRPPGPDGGAIPEPLTFSLATIALGALGLATRRRRGS